MTRGNSDIYKLPNYGDSHSNNAYQKTHTPPKRYNAPFDILLYSLLNGSKLSQVTVLENDRILQFNISPKSSYKSKKIKLQLEFTGKNTNAILLDENTTTIEALRHIDSQSSFRVVQPGIELLPIPPKTSEKISQNTLDLKSIDGAIANDIDNLLEEKYLKIEQNHLQEMKKQKLYAVSKKSKKLSQLLAKLPDQNELRKQMQKYKEYGNIILANLYKIKPYDKKLESYDFEGNKISIKLPKNIKTNRISDYFFNLAKRAKNKASNIHIEKENLESKKNFYDNIYHAVEEAKAAYEIELLVPKRGKSLKKKEKLRDGELYWIEDYKVMVGRNSLENQKLLKSAKANDIWMHTKNIPGSHVIIRTDKQNLPDSVIQSAAKLCVDFSVKHAGDYLVDYTKRKFVKIQEGSHVEYDKYQTIRIRKQ